MATCTEVTDEAAPTTPDITLRIAVALHAYSASSILLMEPATSVHITTMVFMVMRLCNECHYLIFLANPTFILGRVSTSLHAIIDYTFAFFIFTIAIIRYSCLPVIGTFNLASF